MSVSVDSTPSVITIDSENKEVSVVSTPLSVDITTSSNTVDVTPIVNEITIVSEKGDKGDIGDAGELVVKIRVGTDSSLYNSIVLTALCSVTLTGEVDGTRVRVYNGSESNCTIVGIVEDVTDPIIYPYETFDMEYNSDELRWSI